MSRGLCRGNARTLFRQTFAGRRAKKPGGLKTISLKSSISPPRPDRNCLSSLLPYHQEIQRGVHAKLRSTVHAISPLNSLKRSTIEILNQKQERLQVVVMQETPDGQVRARVRDISSIPVASHYDAKGTFIKDTLVLFDMPVSSPALIAGLGK